MKIKIQVDRVKEVKRASRQLGIRKTQVHKDKRKYTRKIKHKKNYLSDY